MLCWSDTYQTFRYYYNTDNVLSRTLSLRRDAKYTILRTLFDIWGICSIRLFVCLWLMPFICASFSCLFLLFFKPLVVLGVAMVSRQHGCQLNCENIYKDTRLSFTKRAHAAHILLSHMSPGILYVAYFCLTYMYKCVYHTVPQRQRQREIYR